MTGRDDPASSRFMGAPDATMLLPPSAGLLMPPGRLLDADPGGGGTESAQLLAEEAAARLARAGQAGLQMAARARAGAAEHAPELRRQAAAAAQIAGKGASAALIAAADARGRAQQAWQASGARPGLRRAVLFGGAAALAVVIGLGWVIARQQATATARREVPAALARLGLAGTVSYAEITASPSGTVTLGHVTWQDGPQAITADSVTVGGLAQGQAGLRRGNLHIRGMAVPVARLRDALPPGLGNMLLGLGYVAPRTDMDASFDLDDDARTLLLDAAARSGGLGSVTIHLRLSGATTGGLSPLVTAYAQKFGLQPDRRFNADGMFAMQAAMQSLTQLSLVEGAITLDDAALAARAVTIPARSMPDEAPSSDEAERDGRFLGGLAGLAAPDQRDRARQAAAAWLKDGGRLVLSADPASPVQLFVEGDRMDPVQLNLDNPAAIAQCNISIGQ